MRTVLVDLLTEHLGSAIDTDDPDMLDGWLTAHVALRAVEWVLDAAGLGLDNAASAELYRRIRLNETVDALAAAHRRQELAWYSDDDVEWPLPVDSYVSLIEEVLVIDLEALPIEPDSWAPIRFGAPNEEDMVRSIQAQDDFAGRFDPSCWVIQRCVGRPRQKANIEDDLDRFIAHWSFGRDVLNPWVEVGRDDAFAHIVAVQRTSLVESVARGRRVMKSWAPGMDVARDRAARFLACFADDTRFFTNGHGYRSPDLYYGNHFSIIPAALFDTGIVMISQRIAGIWWQGEGES